MEKRGRPGRPTRADVQLLTELITSHRNRIINDQGKIVSRLNSVWIDLANEYEKKIMEQNSQTPLKTATAFYTYVSCNKNNIREILYELLRMNTGTNDEPMESSVCMGNNSNNTIDSTILNSSESFMDQNSITSVIRIPGEDFDKFVDAKIITDLSRKSKKRCRQQFEKVPYYVRQVERKRIARELENVHVEMYRANKANETMNQGDSEPAILPSANVSHVLKTEQKKILYLDQDPAKALSMMRKKKHINSIHSIWYDPFCTHYWTSFQIHLFRKCFQAGIKKVSIDATGGLCFDLNSKHVFLYQIVVHCVKQFSVGQMLSTCHRTNDIQYFLEMWVRSGAPSPNEVVVDDSRALLNGVTRTFTSYKNIGEYADALSKGELPQTYIRLDVANFMKTYKNLFGKKKEDRLKKVFWLAVIGQLIVCQDEEKAKQILRSLFIVATSPTAGCLPNNESSSCEKHKEMLDSLIKGDILSFAEVEESEPLNDSAPDESDHDEHIAYSDEDFKVPDEDDLHEEQSGTWYEDGIQYKEEAKKLATEENGRSVNGLYCSRLVKKVLQDLKLFPVWGNVYRDRFGYGRVPATSASSEGEFNKLKNTIMQNRRKRVDEFIDLHLEYINGRNKLDEAAINEVVDTHYNDASDNVDTNQNVDADDIPSLVTGADVNELDFNSGRSKFSNVNNKETCIACSRGDAPTGAHICITCRTSVHAIEPCSYPHGEEGYGQRRVCQTCIGSGSARIVLSTFPEENWRGLGASRSPWGMYLGKKTEQVSAALAWKNTQDLPILRNASSPDLKPVTVNGKSICLTNTCSFDSIFQILLAATFDNDSLKLSAKREKVPLFQLVLDVLKDGVNSTTYRKRAEILMEVCKLSDVSTKVKLYRLDCARVVEWMAQKLFTNCPSFTEHSECERGCEPLIRNTTTKPMDVNILLDKNASQLMATECLAFLGLTKCAKENCSGNKKTTLKEIGPVFIVDISIVDDNKKMRLSQLPHTFDHPIDDRKKMHLVGVVALHYLRPRSLRRRRGENDDPDDARQRDAEKRVEEQLTTIGHYTGWVKRGTQWFEYDDTKEKEITRKYNSKLVPHLLIYLNT